MLVTPMPIRGFTYGHYELLARLPSGAPTLTFLARQRGAGSFKKLVCLRVLIPANLKDESIVDTFLTEARLAAHLNHPSCVTIYDLGKERGAYYISMEYVAGETLAAVIDASVTMDEVIPPALVCSIVAGVCDGLHYAHELHDPTGRPHQLVHGDISPRNIIVTYEGFPKLLDFGIVRTKHEHRGRHAPELPLDRRTDVHAIGLVLYEALAACALGGTEDDRTDIVVGAGRPPKLASIVPGLHPELEAIVEKAIAESPAQRFATAEQLAEALRGYLSSVGFNDRRTSISELVSARFGQKIALRTRTLERLLHGSCDEHELESVLGARPAADLGVMLDVSSSARAPKSGSKNAPLSATSSPPPLPPKTQVVTEAEILDEHTDEVAAMAREISSSSVELWGDRTEHDEGISGEMKISQGAWREPTEIEASQKDLSFGSLFGADKPPKSPISDVGAIAKQSLSADLARGVALANVGAIPQAPVDGEDPPTMPRLKLNGVDQIAEPISDTIHRPSQLPPIADEPEVPTNERMRPKVALPLALTRESESDDPKRIEKLVKKLIEVNALDEPTVGMAAPNMNGSLEHTPSLRPRSFPDSGKLGFSGAFPIIPGKPLDSHETLAVDSAPSIPDTPTLDPTLGSVPAAFESRPAPPTGPTAPLPQLPGGSMYGAPPQPRALDPNVAYVSRNAAIKLMIVGISVGLFMGIAIALLLLNH